MTKVCKTCSEEKPLTSFYATKYGYEYRCKACKKDAYAKKYLENKEKILKASKEYYDKNKEKIAERHAKWRRNNKGKVVSYAQAHRAAKLQATPPWADMDAIRDVYLEAEYQQMQVDHIVPLQNEKVCGLHVWDNLQLLTAPENQSKNNTFNVG
jgi:5-methylcytosine-specific restriction endonuclease McrA